MANEVAFRKGDVVRLFPERFKGAGWVRDFEYIPDEVKAKQSESQGVPEEPTPPAKKTALEVISEAVDTVMMFYDVHQGAGLPQAEADVLNRLTDRFFDDLEVGSIQGQEMQTGGRPPVKPVVDELTSLINENERIGKKDRAAIMAVIEKLTALDAEQGAMPPVELDNPGTENQPPV